MKKATKLADTFTPVQIDCIADALRIAQFATELAQFAKSCQDKTPGLLHKRRALRIVKWALKAAGVCNGDTE